MRPGTAPMPTARRTGHALLAAGIVATGAIIVGLFAQWITMALLIVLALGYGFLVYRGMPLLAGIQETAAAIRGVPPQGHTGPYTYPTGSTHPSAHRYQQAPPPPHASGSGIPAPSVPNHPYPVATSASYTYAQPPTSTSNPTPAPPAATPMQPLSSARAPIRVGSIVAWLIAVLVPSHLLLLLVGYLLSSVLGGLILLAVYVVQYVLLGCAAVHFRRVRARYQRTRIRPAVIMPEGYFWAAFLVMLYPVLTTMSYAALTGATQTGSRPLDEEEAQGTLIFGIVISIVMLVLAGIGLLNSRRRDIRTSSGLILLCFFGAFAAEVAAAAALQGATGSMAVGDSVVVLAIGAGVAATLYLSGWILGHRVDKRTLVIAPLVGVGAGLINAWANSAGGTTTTAASDGDVDDHVSDWLGQLFLANIGLVAVMVVGAWLAYFAERLLTMGRRPSPPGPPPSAVAPHPPVTHAPLPGTARWNPPIPHNAPPIRPVAGPPHRPPNGPPPPHLGHRPR